jgi:predicted metal-dependent hydrolase
MRWNGIEYSLRESQRAKKVILKVSGLGDLVVVVPRGFSKRRLPDILRANETWIEKQLQRVKESLGLPAPEHIDLNAIGERWRVQYRPASDGRFLLQQDAANLLLVQGDVSDVRGLAFILSRWLHLKAHAHLVPWLREVSREVDIAFKNATVKGQTTRWASCSKLGNINLNRSLLFLPERLVRHVFLHELSHIRQPDHSPKFWQQLQKLEADYKALEAETRKANQHVPKWVQLGRS